MMWLLQSVPTADTIGSYVLAPGAALILLALAVLALIWGGMREIYIWGRTHRDRLVAEQDRRLAVEKERDEWKGIAMGLLELGTSATDVASASLARRRSGT